jgi:hypothetical protein
MKLLIMHFSQSSVTSSLFGPNILLSTLFSNTLSLCKGNRNTRRKPIQVPLCPPQIPGNLTWARTRAPAVGSHRLRTSARINKQSSSKLGPVGSKVTCSIATTAKVSVTCGSTVSRSHDVSGARVAFVTESPRRSTREPAKAICV